MKKIILLLGITLFINLNVFSETEYGNVVYIWVNVDDPAHGDDLKNCLLLRVNSKYFYLPIPANDDSVNYQDNYLFKLYNQKLTLAQMLEQQLGVGYDENSSDNRTDHGGKKYYKIKIIRFKN